MNVNLAEMTIGLETELVTATSPNYRVPSWPPPSDWPVVIDRDGNVVSRWGDPIWNAAPWAGFAISFNFGDGEARNGYAEPLNAENAHIMRLIATWLIWGPRAAKGAKTCHGYFSQVRNVVALCNRNGISAANLMRFPKVFEQLPGAITPSVYELALTQLHRIYDSRDVLGFTIVDAEGLRRLAEAAPTHDTQQTAYIPPRIWLHQITRLRECLDEFLAHREKIEACFQFCLDAYINLYGSLEHALAKVDAQNKKSPFCIMHQDREHYPGTFPEVAARFGLDGLLSKWVGGYRNRPDVGTLSNYFTGVTHVGLAYICNFTLQRVDEASSLRASCLVWEEDEKLGRVPLICGETTKTDPESDAMWIASPSVAVAIEALSFIARLRMTCDRVHPVIQPSAADQEDPYLRTSPTEPWGFGVGKARPYHIRAVTTSLRNVLENVCSKLLDPQQMTITAEDLAMARRLTPNLKEERGFAVGQIWPLAWHQYRRTGAVNMFASGAISDSSMQQQLKHPSRLMSLYYGRNHANLHLNKEVEAAVVVAMYQAQVEMIKQVVADDRFVSPHASGRVEELLVRVISAKDHKDLLAMVKTGTIPFRENRLGGCMKAGVCEYGGIESVARCAGGDGGKPCAEVLYDRKKEPQIRADLRRVVEEIKLLPAGHPRHNFKVNERHAMENYLDAISTK